MDRSPVLKVQVLDEIDGVAEYRDIEVEIEDRGIAIRPVGYGDRASIDGRGYPIFIEFRNGIPHVVIRDDINNEEAGHIISMKDAAESKRRKLTK